MLRTTFKGNYGWLNYKAGGLGEVVDRYRWDSGCIVEHVRIAHLHSYAAILLPIRVANTKFQVGPGRKVPQQLDGVQDFDIYEVCSRHFRLREDIVILFACIMSYIYIEI